MAESPALATDWTENLARGRAFEMEVRSAWQGAGRWHSGKEQNVSVPGGRKGYIDLWDDADGLLLIVELKAVDWSAKCDHRSAMKAVQRHKNQVWRYLLADGTPENTQLLIIYSRTPENAELASAIEPYLEEWSVHVLWWDSNLEQHWLRPADEAPAEAKFPSRTGLSTQVDPAELRKPAKVVERISVRPG
ncbi:MAG: hypothetical protein AB7J35_18340 [Dehalococcoidia bacterium]